MLELIRDDPLLSKCLLVAEPWDPGPGGYHLGAFGPKFREWNDKYRDEVRSFWRGDAHRIGSLAHRVAGSDDLFSHADRKPSSGVNFLAVHDGFTLSDLVSYEHKHNEANGEHNRDGHSHNSSWNCGVEGETDDEDILAARRRDVRALLATLFVSRGTPLLAQGDEMGRTQQGNNNAYAQDNEITWLDWGNADGALVDFVASLREFRMVHPALTSDVFLTGKAADGLRDVVWLHPEGREMSVGDWEVADAGVLGMWLGTGDSEVMVWFNRTKESATAALPERVSGKVWQTGLVSDDAATAAINDRQVTLPARSVVALI
jgi:glycogen operon protein